MEVKIMKQEHNEMPKGRKKGRAVLIILVVLLALILLAVSAGLLIVHSTLNKIPRATEPSFTLSQEQIQQIENGEDEEYEDVTEGTVDPTEATLEATEPTEEMTVPMWEPTKIQGDHIINILLIGQDRRPGEGRARSDAMILCTFNLKDNTLTMTSFLRDLYVKIPGYKDNRMNAAYALGGMRLLDNTLEQNFGVVVDGNVEVDFAKFETIINMLGGVDIKLTSAEAKHLGLPAGWNHLNGTDALRYARIRKLDSDFGRTNRQRNVLNGLIQAYRNKPLDEMLALMDDILPVVTTDMSNGEMISLVMKVFPMLSGMSVSTQHIPAAGTYTSTRIRGMAVLYPDIQANQYLLVESLLKP